MLFSSSQLLTLCGNPIRPLPLIYWEDMGAQGLHYKCILLQLADCFKGWQINDTVFSRVAIFIS